MRVAGKLVPLTVLVAGAVFAQDPPLSGGCWATAGGGCTPSAASSNSRIVTAHRPTFYKDVLPVLQTNCQSCHRPGEVGPMAFTDYKGTRPFAKAIKMVFLRGKADPHFSRFENERHLSEADIKTLTAWADAGAPEGDAPKKVEPVK